MKHLLNNDPQLPEKIEVILNQDDTLTNILLVINIIASIFVAYYIQERIEKKAKEYEVKAHVKKNIADKIIKIILELNSTFSALCKKNLFNDSITPDDINELDKLIISEEVIFLSNKSKENIKNFRDYLFDLIERPEKKNIMQEKSFFFLLKKSLDEL
ncbi:hypothetical protein BTO06_09235 [Tenacibaculum sp. SZ-18]|uniref:hypothetical protein n=1 Tax=Tenacibaculum sp. SZ-18 TaxID=754423 RepID=UPI000C2D4824|nr:hypothetical protein [Tenacibaculum sp. SZ-18]AUC15312.1 hypothetical protein BTO06_09235 [Tenacibaculum sp. SZ-18]